MLIFSYLILYSIFVSPFPYFSFLGIFWLDETNQSQQTSCKCGSWRKNKREQYKKKKTKEKVYHFIIQMSFYICNIDVFVLIFMEYLLIDSIDVVVIKSGLRCWSLTFLVSNIRLWSYLFCSHTYIFVYVSIPKQQVVQLVLIMGIFMTYRQKTDKLKYLGLK